jgi:hypothetical protein
MVAAVHPQSDRWETPMFLRSLVVLLLLTATSGPAWADSVQIVPANPRYFETVYLRSTLPGNDGRFIITARVSMQGTALTVDYTSSIDLPGPPPSFTVMLGKFPAGTYTVQANLPNGPLTTQFTVSPKPPEDLLGGARSPVIDFTGLWWNPAESGWGLYIAQGPTNKIFAIWVVYDAVGNPTWYTLQPEPGSWGGTSIYHGTVVRTMGPYFRGTFDPSLVMETIVGTGTLEFFGPDSASGTFIYTIDGQQGIKHIERMPIE